MRDNVSIIIAAIVGGILVVLMPLISILERQDNMTYNVALTLTTNFVDEIRSKGFIDKKSYNDYMGKMAQTGCLYEYQIEAHKKIIIPVSDDDGNIISDKYEEDTLIQNKQDIETLLLSNSVQNVESSEKKEVYLFDEGDEFYIKVKNTNATSSSMLYKYISGQSNETVINVSYGGIINNINWELYNQTLELGYNKATQPDVTFGLPKNGSGVTKYTTDDSYTAVQDPLSGDWSWVVTGKTCNYKFDLKDDLIIKFDVTLRNFEKFYSPEHGIMNNLTSDCLLDYIAKNDFKGTISIENLRRENGAYRFTIKISDIITYAQRQDISVSIRPGLGSGNGYISSGFDSPLVTIMNDYTIHSVTMTGPYSSITNKLISTNIISPNKVFYNRIDYSTYFQNIYFLINYTSIDNDVDVITEAAKNNFRIGYGGTTKTLSQATTDGIIKNDWSVGNTANEDLKYGTIRVELSYRNSFGSSQENFAMIPAGWVTGAKNDGVEIDALGGQAYGARIPDTSKYAVLKDTQAPSGNIKVHVKYPETDTWAEALYNPSVPEIVYEVPNSSSQIKIDLSNIKDLETPSVQGSGVCYIQLSNDGVNFNENFLYTGSDQKILWNIDTSLGNKIIYYKLIDNMGHTSAILTQKIKVIAAGVPVMIYALINGTTTPANTIDWYNKDLKVIATVDDSTGWLSPAGGYKLTLLNKVSGYQTVNSVNSPPPSKLSTEQTLSTTGRTEFLATGKCNNGYFLGETTAQCYYHVDKIGPRITINPETIPTTWVKTLATTLSVMEPSNESRLESIKYGITTKTDEATIVDSDLTITETNLSSTTNMPLAEKAYGGSVKSGKINICVRARDKATNETTKIIHNVKIDNEGPKITYTTNASNTGKRDITIIDLHSGINLSTIQYARASYRRISDTTPEPSPWTQVTTSQIAYNPDNSIKFTIDKGTSSAQRYTWVKVTDNAGNESIVSLEFGEDPQIKVSNTYGGRWTPNDLYKDYPGTQIDADMMGIVYGYYGAIEYEISGLSTLSEVHMLLSDGEKELQDLKDEISDSTKSNCGTNATRKVTYSITNWGSETAKYLYIVVKKSNGDCVAGGNLIMSGNSIQIAAVNGIYLNGDSVTIPNDFWGNSDLKSFVISGISDICANPGNYEISLTYENWLGTQSIVPTTTSYNNPTTNFITINTSDSVYTGLGATKTILVKIKNKNSTDEWTSSVTISG